MWTFIKPATKDNVEIINVTITQSIAVKISHWVKKYYQKFKALKDWPRR